MNNNNDVIKQYKEAFPAFGSYMECMSRTFLTGLASFSLGNIFIIIEIFLIMDSINPLTYCGFRGNSGNNIYLRLVCTY